MEVKTEVESLHDRFDAIDERLEKAEKSREHMFGVVDNVKTHVFTLESLVAPTTGETPYSEMTRDERIRSLRYALIERARDNRFNKASMEYGDVRTWFDDEIPPGTAYRTMKAAAKLPGFNYDEPDGRPNRVTCNLDATISATEHDGSN